MQNTTRLCPTSRGSRTSVADHVSLGRRLADHVNLGRSVADHVSLGTRVAGCVNLGTRVAGHVSLGSASDQRPGNKASSNKCLIHA